MAYRFDIFQSKAKGMVLVDALIPQWVADRMLDQPTAAPGRFDLFQSKVKGMVSVDALIPPQVADRMLALLATV
jgi:hypothetical protein